MRLVALLLFIAFTFIDCNRAPKNIDQKIAESELVAIENIPDLSKEEGIALLKINCYTCHNPQSKSHDEMLAPPLAGIKHHYLKYYPDRNTFIARMSDFIDNPSKENAIMKGPIRRFGLMPKTTLDKEKIQLITAFMFDNKLDVPSWFPDHFKDEKGTTWKSEE